MNPIATLCATLLLVAAVSGGSQRRVRQSGSGWAAPAPSSGWSGSPAAGTNINLQGASLAGGEGYGVAEHQSTTHVEGTPGSLYVNSGSGVGLYQSASNYQQSNINPDGSSNAVQGNSAANSGYAYDYHGVDAQGDLIDAQSTGWSAVEGVGVVEQVDSLNHTAGGQGAGWKKQ